MITPGQLAKINTLLEDTHVSTNRSIEEIQAEACLKKLITPYVATLADSNFTAEDSKTLSPQIDRFFRLRSKVASKNKSSAVDAVDTYLSEEKILPKKTLSTEEQVSAAMLQEIFLKAQQSTSNTKNMTQMNNTSGEQELGSISKSVLSENVYVLACDAKTSLLNLYKHTEQSPTKDYLNQHKPLVHLAIECDANELLTILVAKRNGDINSSVVECLDGLLSRDTPLRFAATYNKHEAIPILLAAGANVHAASTTGRTALSCALKQTHPSEKTFCALLASDIATLIGSNTFYFDGKSLQRWAVENKNSSIIVALAKLNILDFNEKYDNGNSIIHKMAEHDWHQALAQATPSDDMLRLSNATGYTPLLLAIQSGHKTTATLLLQKSSALLSTDPFSPVTAWAAYHGWKEGVQQSIAARPTATTAPYTRTPLNLVIDAPKNPCNFSAEGDTEERQAIVALLLKQPSIREVINKKEAGETPLSAAVSKGSPNIVALLVAHSATIISGLIDGKTLAQVAAERCKTNPDWTNVTAALEKRAAEKATTVPITTAAAIAIKTPSPEEIIAALKNELAEKEKIIVAQQKELIEKNALIATMAFNLNTATQSATSAISAATSVLQQFSKTTPVTTNVETKTVPSNNISSSNN